MTGTHSARHPCRTTRPGFTLIELLVVMGVIVILIGVTVISVGAIARDSQLSTGTNQVKSILGQARALAMRERRVVGVVFRSVVDTDTLEQWTEGVVVGDTGGRQTFPGANNQRTLLERFEVVPGTEAVRLPKRIRVAGPFYSGENNPGNPGFNDELWLTQTNLLNSNEAFGRQIGVFFTPDGSIEGGGTPVVPSGAVSHLPMYARWVDFDTDGIRDVTGNDPLAPYEHRSIGDENLVHGAPFLAVYDNQEAREFYDSTQWNNANQRDLDLKNYIDEYADRIHFNRYTGVVMR